MSAFCACASSLFRPATTISPTVNVSSVSPCLRSFESVVVCMTCDFISPSTLAKSQLAAALRKRVR